MKTYTNTISDQDLEVLESQHREQKAEIKRLRDDMNEFRLHLEEGASGFDADLQQSLDMIGTHDGHYVAYAEVIAACGGGTYACDPLELIGEITAANATLNTEVGQLAKENEDIKTAIIDLMERHAV